MDKLDYWTASAEAMELTNEGNKLIANEIERAVHNLWKRVVRVANEMLHSSAQPRHLPPV